MSFCYTLILDGKAISTPVITRIKYFPVPQAAIVMGYINLYDPDHMGILELLQWAAKSGDYEGRSYKDISLEVQLAGQKIREYKIPRAAVMAHIETYTNKDGFGRFEFAVQCRDVESGYRYLPVMYKDGVRHVVYRLDDLSTYAVDNIVEYAQNGSVSDPYGRIGLCFNVVENEKETITGRLELDIEVNEAADFLGGDYRALYDKLGQLISDGLEVLGSAPGSYVATRDDMNFNLRDAYDFYNTRTELVIMGEGIKLTYNKPVKKNDSSPLFKSIIEEAAGQVAALSEAVLDKPEQALAAVSQAVQQKAKREIFKGTKVDEKISVVIETPKFGYLPKNNGKWVGEEGNLEWVPDPEFTPKNPKSNPEQLSWEKIFERYGIESIAFNDGQPDFSPISKGTVTINDFSPDRDDNFDSADEALADKKGCTKADVRRWRKKNKYTWHERKDCKTMDKVPTCVHGNVPHSGGISELKKEEG